MLLARIFADGWLYTDSDWHKPSPYAYGHKNQPLVPPPRSGQSVVSSVSDSEGEEDDDDDELPHDLGAARNAPRAATRKRRWLRRAVWVGGPGQRH